MFSPASRRTWLEPLCMAGCGNPALASERWQQKDNSIKTSPLCIRLLWSTHITSLVSRLDLYKGRIILFFFTNSVHMTRRYYFWQNISRSNLLLTTQSYLLSRQIHTVTDSAIIILCMSWQSTAVFIEPLDFYYCSDYCAFRCFEA